MNILFSNFARYFLKFCEIFKTCYLDIFKWRTNLPRLFFRSTIVTDTRTFMCQVFISVDASPRSDVPCRQTSQQDCPTVTRGTSTSECRLAARVGGKLANVSSIYFIHTSPAHLSRQTL